jgi:radical SAM-linked protein
LRQTLKAKFKIEGSLRFISHQEMLRVWQRALLRAIVPVCFSEGFNPHPKISLPLPRSVGIEASDELALVCLERDENEPFDENAIVGPLAAQLPDGCILQQVEICDARKSCRPTGAAYFLPVQVSQEIKNAVEKLLLRLAASERITIERRIDENGRSRVVDVTEYINSVEIKNDGVLIDCRISPAGSIRVNEIMSLLHIEPALLAGPVRRDSVQWLEKN